MKRLIIALAALVVLVSASAAFAATDPGSTDPPNGTDPASFTMNFGTGTDSFGNVVTFVCTIKAHVPYYTGGAAGIINSVGDIDCSFQPYQEHIWVSQWARCTTSGLCNWWRRGGASRTCPTWRWRCGYSWGDWPIEDSHCWRFETKAGGYIIRRNGNSPSYFPSVNSASIGINQWGNNC